VILAGCSAGKKGSSSSPTSLSEQTTTSALPTTPVVARLLWPEKGSIQGSAGMGMVVVLTFTAKDASALAAEFRLGGSLPAPAAAVKPGHNPAFPGLVVGLSTTSIALGGASANLANLFQIVSPAKQADGSLVVTAVWTNAAAAFGTDTDVTLVAFTVTGVAPDVIPQSSADLSPSSNPLQSTFHISAADTGVTSTTAAPGSSTSTTAGKSSSTTSTTKPASTVPASTSTTKPATTSTVAATTTTTTPRILGLF
jgi:hypothetical protein